MEEEEEEEEEIRVMMKGKNDLVLTQCSHPLFESEGFNVNFE